MLTPDFPAWASALASQLHDLRAHLGPSLHQFEALFTPWIPRWRLAQQDQGEHSREGVIGSGGQNLSAECAILALYKFSQCINGVVHE